MYWFRLEEKLLRTKNSIKNTSVGLITQIFSTFLTFINRTVFIYVLGANYLGINGLFSNILAMLSLAELGVGSAITYHMYKPLASNDKEKLKSLMKIYEKAYRTIGFVVAGIGYKSSIIIADQKNYIVNIKQQIFNLIQSIFQIIILFLTHNYFLYLIMQIIISLGFNISISKKAEKLYPFLKEKEYRKLDKQEKQLIFKHVLAMMSHKVGGVVVNSTDNLLISTFVGVYWVGIYSNYVMIINMINTFMRQIFNALTASVGNLNATDDKEKSYEIYKRLLFANFWYVYG